MNAKMLITGAAVAVLAAGAALAQTDPSSSAMSPTTGDTAAGTSTATTPMHHRRHKMHESKEGAGAYAAPKQPIPYAQLDQYMKSSPKQRMAMAQQADTGSSVDTAATAAAAPGDSSMGASGSDKGSITQEQGGSGGTSPSDPMGTAGAPTPGGTGAMDSRPPVNGSDTGAADQMPTMGQGHNGSNAPGTPAAGTPNQSSGPTPQ
jgi:hypothetical protein